MEKIQIDNLLTELTSEQKVYLFNKLKSLFFSGISKEVTVCPCCNANKFIKHGSYKGIQKFKCLTTSKIFTYKTNTVISGIFNMDKLTQLIEMLATGRFPTVREIVREIGVSMQTAFDWRTKILTAIYEDVELNNNIVEFDETNFRLSRKGRKGMDQKYCRKRGNKLVGDNEFNVKVFMSYSRGSKKLELYTSHMGRTKSTDVENYLGVKKNLVIYSDKHKSYSKFFNDNGVENKTFKSSNHISLTDNNVHNQTINFFSGKLGRFLDDELRGVSTKYLQGYLNWVMFVQNNKEEIKLKDSITKNKLALEVFKQKEMEFKYFLKNNGRNDYGTYNDRYYGMVG